MGEKSKYFLIVLAAAIAAALVFVYANYGLKFAAPALVACLVVAAAYFFRGLKAPLLYLIVFLLPVFVARYLAPIPDVDHPGVLNVPALYGYQLPLYVLAFVWLLGLLAGTEGRLFISAGAWGAALLFFPAGLSLFWAFDASYGLYELWRVADMFLLLLVVANLVKTDRQLKIILGLLTASVLVQSLLSVVQFFAPYATADILANFGVYVGFSHARPYDPTSPLRVAGTTGYCNSLAGYFELVLPIFVALLFFTPVLKKWRPWFMVTLVLAVVTLFLTFSRGGVLGVAVAMVALVWTGAYRFPHLKGRVMKIMGVIGVQIAFLIIILSEQLLMRFSFFMTKSMEDDVRVALVRNAWEMIKAHPLVGVGLNNFPEAFLKYEVSGLTFDISYPVHNTWLLIAAEQGFIGLALFIMFMALVFRDGRRAINESSSLRAAVAIGITAGLVGWFAHNLVAPLYQNWLVNRQTFFFMVGLLAALPRIRDDGLPQP